MSVHLQAISSLVNTGDLNLELDFKAYYSLIQKFSSMLFCFFD